MDPAKGALRTVMRGPTLAGIGSVILLVGGFTGWASTGLLAAGAIAPGVVSPDSSRKTIQHLEPGIVGEIMVRDGDHVEAGAQLVLMEDTLARATHDMLVKQSQSLMGRQARLKAEQLNQNHIDFPKELLEAAGKPEVTEILSVQLQMFVARRVALESRKRILQQRTRAIEEQIVGFEAQLAGARERVQIIDEELDGKRFLLDRMLVPKPQVLALERARTEITANIGQYQAAIAEGKQKITETELQLVGLDTDRADEIAAELDKVREEWGKVREQLRTTEDTLRRTVIVAPVSGTVVNLRFKTKGGIIQSGEPVLDIVPDKDELVIDAHVSPNDIDVVHAGLTAQVHFTAFANRRSLPRIDGTVRSVSADTLRDEKTGAPYYLARVEVNREALAEALGSEHSLVPGMPAEVLIVTGERTLFGYLLTPVRDIFRRSLRES
ncbi:MAG: HlyD family type I secretion periplasmic adaptor subunit [Gammaproteobacteria bacterium]